MVIAETGLSVVQALSIKSVTSEADALVNEGAQLGEELLARGYSASYLPGSSYQGLFGDFLISSCDEEATRVSPMNDKNDVIQFVGGVIASSEYEGMPLDTVVRQQSLSYICLGVMQTMLMVETANEGQVS